MSNYQSKEKIIAKNTLMMYIRMFITMAIYLFSSRIVLQALGVTDFGIYNLVGGVVTFFVFVNSAMMAATQRFLNYEMGKGDTSGLSTVFKTSYIIHIILAIIIVSLGCIIGKILIYHELRIQESMLDTATFVLYASCATCGLQILTLPFSSVIIAHERLNVYAIISIIDAILKLGAAYLICGINHDRLIIYALLLTAIQLSMFFLYALYCKRHFKEVKGRLTFSLGKLKIIGKFALWSMIGCLSSTFANQGISILLGMFFLPAVNAARGIASQVQGAVSTFGSNLNTAMAPQITQSYASGDLRFFYNIIYRGSKYVFILMSIIAIPILLRTEYIIDLWLEEIPTYTISFIRWLLCASIIETISYPLMRASDASGKIRIYHCVVGGILLLILPVAYLALKIKNEPIIVFQAYFLIDAIAWFARLAILHFTVGLSIVKYIKEVMFRVVLIFALSLVVSYKLTYALPQSFIGLITTFFCCLIITLAISYTIGFDGQEKQYLNKRIKTLRNII